MQDQFRYPGTRSFSEKERNLFFGRSKDTRVLSELILIENLVVLFSKSGYGKSSLLNAGVIPILKEKAKCVVLNIRFKDKDLSPVNTIMYHLSKVSIKPTFASQKLNIQQQLKNDLIAQLWYYIKNLQLQEQNPNAIILVLDQFEELSSFTHTQIQEFGSTLATLLNLHTPISVRNVIKQELKANNNLLTEEETNLLLKPLNLKIVLSLRSDKLSLLNQIKSYLPAVFKKTYELQPLDENQALEALMEPAVKKGDFVSPPFSYSEKAKQLIIKNLKDTKNQRIETFQLQLICQHAEEQIIQKRLHKANINKYELDDIDIGRPEDIFENHYNRIISSLPESSQRNVRLFIEEKLIVEGNRVPLPEGLITKDFNIDISILEILVSKRLLRSEPNSLGGISYELSHDTLVSPILKAAEIRHQKEEAELEVNNKKKELLEAKEKIEKEREERKIEQKRQRRIIIIVGSFAIFAFVSLIWAVSLNIEVKIKNKKIDAFSIDAADLLSKILKIDITDPDSLGEHTVKIAEEKYKNGLYEDAINYYKYARLMSENTNLKSKINFRVDTIKIIQGLLYKAGQDNMNRNYMAAIKNYEKILQINSSDSITKLRINIAESLYNGYMVKVDGGMLDIGDNKDVKVKTFYIAKYELTNFLYCKVMGMDTFYFKNKLQYPFEKITGMDAIKYCNRLSELLGLTPYYSIKDANHIQINSTAKGFRLPTLNEWEYAAGGGVNNKSIWSGTNEINELSNYAWYRSNSDQTSPVGKLLPNALNLYDMSGNVWEWCLDLENETKNNQNTSSIELYKPVFQYCGGSWISREKHCMVAYRRNTPPAYNPTIIGFRLVHDP